MTTMTEKRVNADALRDFCVKVFERLGVVHDDAWVTADNLVAADLRGISSHGVARLIRYVRGLQDGVMKARADERITRETPTTLVVDAGAGLGQPASFRAMKKCIEKAGKMGVSFAVVNNSNHYGIAGYYAMMALEHDMVGISMTNTDSLAVPTFGKDSLLGTNPIAVAIPAGRERPYVLDMATTVVPRGKLEVYDRLEKEMPMGWATDDSGLPSGDATRVLKSMNAHLGGGLLPLGGAGEEMSGHKGYGMMLLVEILTGVLSGAAFADGTYPKDKDGKPLPANLGHFFGAFRVDHFRDVADFKADMDRLIGTMKGSAKAVGQDRVYIHGEKEFEKTALHMKEGVPIHQKVDRQLGEIGSELGIPYGL